MTSTSEPKRLTTRDIREMRARGESVAVLTAYDFVTAALLDEVGVDILLVGDSLGNVVLGYDTTVPVTLDDMLRHTAAVVRGSSHALVVCDLPFGETTGPEVALSAAVRALKETGCQAVKLEGGIHAALTIQRLTREGIAVMAHVGLMPQHVNQIGGYSKQGKTPDAAQRIHEDALAVQEAGAFCVVIEAVSANVASDITAKLSIPTIGIGSGEGCSGQVLVINDLIGLGVRPAPSFAKARADVAGLIRAAAAEYVRDVRGG